MLPDRHGSSEKYRHGYQGSEKDDEVKGEGNSYTTHYRLLDPRVGRWLTRDPKFTAFESPYGSMRNNPILFNDKAGDTIRNARIADYQNKTPKYHHSRPGFDNYSNQTEDVWTITPYFDKNDKVVAYAAGRLSKGNDYAIEYYLDKGDYAKFIRNIGNYTLAANLFMMNGPPSEANLAFMSGLQKKSFSEAFQGLKKLWGEALSDPVWVTTTLILFADGAVNSLSRASYKKANVFDSKTLSTEDLLKEKSFLEKAMAEDLKQLENGKNQMAREMNNGHTSNPHGLANEVNTTIPQSIKYKQDRINEINGLLNK